MAERPGEVDDVTFLKHHFWHFLQFCPTSESMRHFWNPDIKLDKKCYDFIENVEFWHWTYLIQVKPFLRSNVRK